MNLREEEVPGDECGARQMKTAGNHSFEENHCCSSVKNPFTDYCFRLSGRPISDRLPPGLELVLSRVKPHLKGGQAPLNRPPSQLKTQQLRTALEVRGQKHLRRVRLRGGRRTDVHVHHLPAAWGGYRTKTTHGTTKRGKKERKITRFSPQCSKEEALLFPCIGDSRVCSSALSPARLVRLLVSCRCTAHLPPPPPYHKIGSRRGCQNIYLMEHQPCVHTCCVREPLVCRLHQEVE